jgi:hypothetical protein
MGTGGQFFWVTNNSITCELCLPMEYYMGIQMQSHRYKEETRNKTSRTSIDRRSTGVSCPCHLSPPLVSVEEVFIEKLSGRYSFNFLGPIAFHGAETVRRIRFADGRRDGERPFVDFGAPDSISHFIPDLLTAGR